MKKILILLLCSIIVSTTLFTGCISEPNVNNEDNTNNNDNNINNNINLNLKTEKFKVIPANKELYEEFIKNRPSNNYYSPYMNTLRAPGEMLKTVDSAGNSATQASQSNTVNRYSTTNVQVEGIDEGDIVKTNGKTIYFSPQIYQNKNTYIIDTLPANLSEIIGKIPLKGTLYLKDNNLIIISNENNKIYSYNVENPKSPKLNWKIDLNNTYYVNSRIYNNKLYLIVAKYDFNGPILFNNYKIPYDKIYLPVVPPYSYYPSENNYIISSINLDSGKTENSIGTIGGYNTITYMSKDNLYFINSITGNENKLYLKFLNDNSNKYFPEEISSLIGKVINSELFGDEAKRLQINTILEGYYKTLSQESRLNLENKINKDYENYIKENIEKLQTTGIVKIKLDDFSVISGEVPGKPLNQFSLDEENNYLRIATTLGDTWRYRDSSINNLYVLDNNLNIVGSVKGLGEGERIYAVRFIGDKAYIITYRETDPLYVLDLKDPKNPKILGKLKIPGYSTYLHPIGNNKLIGIGKDENRKIKISLYDVSNYENPKEIDKYSLPEYWSEALYNPHAILWDKDNKLFVIPVQNHAYIFKIGENNIKLEKDDEHSKKYNTDTTNKYYYYIYNRVLRALYINNYLYAFSNNEIHIININNMKTVKKIDLTEYYNNTPIYKYKNIDI